MPVANVPVGKGPLHTEAVDLRVGLSGSPEGLASESGGDVRNIYSGATERMEPSSGEQLFPPYNHSDERYNNSKNSEFEDLGLMNPAFSDGTDDEVAIREDSNKYNRHKDLSVDGGPDLSQPGPILNVDWRNKQVEYDHQTKIHLSDRDLPNDGVPKYGRTFGKPSDAVNKQPLQEILSSPTLATDDAPREATAYDNKVVPQKQLTHKLAQQKDTSQLKEVEASHGIDNQLILLPSLETLNRTVKSNSTQLNGIRYDLNLPGRPDLSPSLTKSPPIQEIVVQESKNITFGSEIGSPGNLILNQYVDLSNGLPPHSRVTVTDSSEPECVCGRKGYVCCALVVLLVLAAAIALFALPYNADTPNQDQGPVLGLGSAPPANYTLLLVSRGQWSSHADIPVPELTVKPARMVIISHTAGGFCSSTPVCENLLGSIESYHIHVGFNAIGYNFMIGGDGRIYEGRGWEKFGSHTYKFNCASVGVSFIGNFDKDELTAPMLEAYKVLVEEGVRRGALAGDYKLFGHYQIKENSSPGLNIQRIIKTWPHWVGRVTKEDRLCD